MSSSCNLSSFIADYSFQQETCSDDNFRNKLKTVASQALLRAEKLKEKLSAMKFDELAANLPDVPSTGAVAWMFV